jgi:hypothetical protein
MKIPKTALHETIIEGGPMTEEECRRTLAGKSGMPELRAVVSRIEYAIGTARSDSEVLGQASQTRDEAIGAVVHLRLLRQEVMEMVKSARREETEE